MAVKVNESFCPELHDVGKLINLSEVFGSGWEHYFGKRRGKREYVDIPYSQYSISKPNNVTWEVIVSHHKKNICDNVNSEQMKSYSPDKRKAIWLTILADRIAAQMARTPEYLGGEGSVNFEKPWRFNTKTNYYKDKLINNLDEVKQIIDFISRNGSWKQFLKQYYDKLKTIPQDKTPPHSPMSLLTHMTLTGKLFRIFANSIVLDDNNWEQWKFIYNNIPVELVSDAQQKWSFRLIEAKVNFPQQPVRSPDLQVFSLLESKLSEIALGSHKDNVLFNTTDTIWLLLSLEGDIETVFQPVLDYYFFIDYIDTKAPLDILKPGYLQYKSLFEKLKK